MAYNKPIYFKDKNPQELNTVTHYYFKPIEPFHRIVTPVDHSTHLKRGQTEGKGITNSNHYRRAINLYNKGTVKEVPWSMDANYYYSIIGIYNQPDENDTVLIDQVNGRKIGVRRKGQMIYHSSTAATMPEENRHTSGFYTYGFTNFFEKLFGQKEKKQF